MDFYTELKFILNLFIAFLLGAIIGFERTHIRKTAGLRTYSLISVAGALLAIISYNIFSTPHIAAAVITGMGFIGAGLIIHHGSRVEGITTAASLWITAAIGIASGLGLYILALASTFFAILSMGIFRAINLEWKLDELLFKNKKINKKSNN